MSSSETYSAQAEAVIRAQGGKRPPSADAKVLAYSLLAIAAAIREGGYK